MSVWDGVSGRSDMGRDYLRTLELEMMRASHESRVMGLLEVVAARLFRGEIKKLPFEFAQAHGTNENVFLFVVHKGEGLMFTDPAGLFPSDTLVTQLRLLIDG